MSSIPLHPAIVHLPLALGLLVPLIALGVAVAVHQGKLPRWAWGAVLGLQVLLVGSGFVAMQTGERDEEVVERVVAESVIEAHEEAAETFVYAAAGSTLLFLLGLALPRRIWRSAAMGAAVAGSVAVAGLALGVGHSGGELVYVHGAAAAHVSGAPGGATRPAPAVPTGVDVDDD
ncbi:MAG: DUF2231 domain-containing protein [Sandaracinaceae bacterium]